MKVVIIYATVHGRTLKVVEKSIELLDFTIDKYNISQLTESLLDKYDLIIIFCPTYGDQELPTEMEFFLNRFSANLEKKKFLICELGNYYGYDDFSFGALHLIRKKFLALGCKELSPHLSLDSYPRVAWQQLKNWINSIKPYIKNV